MELFNRFRDTVFLKEDSDLEKQLEVLKRLRTKLGNKNEIDKDIKKLEYGIVGEKQIAFELKNAHIGMYVLHDVTYECDGNTAQIDYLIFTRGNFYLVECKNLYGNISIDSNGQFFREWSGKKEGIYSPYTQANRHKDMLKKVWSANHNKIDNFLWGNSQEHVFKPIVVLSNPKSFLNKNYAPSELKKNVIRADQLVDYIKNDIEHTSDYELLNEGLLKKAATVWLDRSSKITNETLIDKYVYVARDSLTKELKDFRTKRSKERKIPPYYVFTDDELLNILSRMPKSVEELRKFNLLSPDAKIKCHGEDIIKIINKFLNN